MLESLFEEKKLSTFFHFIREILFVLGFGLGMLLVHEVGHILIHLFMGHQITKVVFFPFLFEESSHVIVELNTLTVIVGSVDTLADRLYLDSLITTTLDFFVPLIVQLGYVFFFRKRLTTMELKLWVFISFLLIRTDFLSFYYFFMG